ncbi:Efflux pump membrane transporter BepE [Salinivirga cyanobacteriivorans]|uniref:Efflux pump membrane transporter BepE n=1 Tax=Salinivirga cyanobacteriivorans TaxID=1307839 RepID=A0A0S2HUI8_9BACT|nr:efflux RND transporter permease subunit [Salinivirga cyanobacteriivorans]ALO13736.1 Efflux pump membrane transporter BepE [Salinivirga cyanobacteriivorans]
MGITSLVLKHHKFATIIFLLLFVVGMNSFLNMPRTENPQITVPAATVFAIYPGANPVDLEQLIAQPIEDAISELEDIKRVSTSIRDGLVVVNVEFYFGVDTDEKYNKVVQEINSVREVLPDDLYSLETLKWRVSDQVLMQLALTADSLPYHVLRTKAEKIQDAVKKLSAIRKVEVLAAPEQEVIVELDMEKMGVLNLGIDRVEKAIKSNNANIPGGSVKLGKRSFGVKTSGAYTNLDQIAATVVHAKNGYLIRLKDVATIRMGDEDEKYKARFKGTKSVFVAIYQKEGRNVFETTKEVDRVLQKIDSQIGANIELNQVFKQSREVENKISNFQGNLFQGIALVGILIFLALGVRSAFLVIIAIPLSIIIGLFGVDISGFAMQQMTIAGLVIALGLLVDNSIVMTEGINRYIDQGNKPAKAAVLAAAEIGWPVITATLTTVLAFVPIIAMPDKAGVFIRSMPVTIILTLSVSLLLALTLTPLLASRFFKNRSKPTTKNDGKQAKGIKRLLNYLVEHSYRDTIVFALKHRWLVIWGAIGVFSITMLMAYLYLGISFFPKAEKGQFLVRAHLPQGSSLEHTSEVVTHIETVLDTIPDVKFYASNIGHGNPRIYYNVLSKNYQKSFGEVFVQLESYDVDKFDALVDRLRGLFDKYTDARIEIKEFEQSPPVDAPIMVYIKGNELERLRKISKTFENLLASQPGVINLDNSLSKVRTDLLVDINRDKANMYGVPVHAIDKAVRTAVAGMQVDQFRDEKGEEYPITLRMPQGDEFSPDDFRKVYVKSMAGYAVPLHQLASIKFQKAPNEIRRFNYERTALLTADLEKGASLDDALEPVIARLKSYNFPDGYDYYIGGELESRKESFGGMQRAVLIAILMIFAVLVLQFKSYTQPLIIFATIPLAMIGSVYALMITGNTFSFTAFIGLTSLVGIVINNAIILVDYTNWLRKEGYSKFEALRISGETRFTPIILTTLTTAGGLLPLTLQGGDLWAPMGWTIIGGLLISTFLTLVVVPVLYSVVVKEN